MKKIVFSILLALATFAPARASYIPASAYLAQLVSLPVGTSGSPADLGSVNIPYARYVVTAVYVETTAATGTLTTATIDLRTATGGGGSSVLSSATALTSLTGNNLVQSISVATLSGSSVQTAGTLTLRQTINSLFSGTISVDVVVVPVP